MTLSQMKKLLIKETKATLFKGLFRQRKREEMSEGAKETN